MNPLQLDNNYSYLHSPIIVALDFPNADKTISFVRQLNPNTCQIKIGKELFTTTGRQFVESLVTQGFKVFLDLKYHDIPNTVQQACKVAADIGVWMLNVHASGGLRMMEAAMNGITNSFQQPLLIAVTVLTSMDETDFSELGIKNSLQEQVLKLATLAKQAGLDGVVCSAQEVISLKEKLGHDFITVTPGIRLTDSTSDDQRRIVTPQKALNIGTDYIVIGRPITQAENPLAIIDDINSSYRYIKKS